MSDTHINVWIAEANEARTAISAAIEDFKHKVGVVRTKAEQLGDELEPTAEAAIKALEADFAQLTGKKDKTKNKQPAGKS